MLSVISKSPQETSYIGERMAKYLSPGDFISLTGDLGAGKTLFAQGIARGLGIEDHITSPTFTIIHEYNEGRLPLYHMDVYRVNGVQDMENLGYEEYFYGQGVSLVEWANLISEIIPPEHLRLDFKVVPEGREITFYPQGRYYERLVEELTGHAYSGN
ncbi:MAG: tRNA (adenosine(37)-N6)-threonylcarbamoyltransferase complex ATPase subunit type 1 TsaE [Clostridia bacterium]|nr:tRNA (adenosine(37)-N6)-threonylcarbamoyltransferase complex ATPase subunit type 1 TsaE [Clostridia bacterium]